MRRFRRRWLCFHSGSLLALAAFCAGSGEELRARFDYDASAALDSKETLLLEKRGLKVFDLSYASPRGGRVSGFLVLPSGRGPFAAIVFGHWGPGNRTEFLPEAQIYAQAGAASVMIDYPWVRPAPHRRNINNIKEPQKDLEILTQAVIDLRRAIDLLVVRPGVDPERIGYIGHSWGAQWGAILSAVEDRITAAVLIGGIPDQDSIYLENDDPDLVSARAELGLKTIQNYCRVLAPLAAARYVPHAAPTPLLFQFARFERYFSESAMKRYYAAASEPKSVRWYDTGHDLNDPQVLADRAAWIAKQLKMRSPAGILRRRAWRQ